MKLQRLAILALLALAGGAAAQQTPHVCGAGPGPNEVMAGVQPAGPGVAPTPLCYWKSGQQEQQQPSQPTGYWEKTWGAIAGNPTTGILGSALGASSRTEATQQAISDCQSKGGGGGCRVEITYHNQCAVLVVGDKGSLTARAASIEEASRIGINKCSADGDSGCRVHYSACTEPIFHKY